MIRLWFAASLALLFVFAPGNASAENVKQKKTVKLPADKKQLHIYLLLGQANMSGRGFAYKEDRNHDEKIVALDKDGNWRFASEPLHYDKPPGMAGVGPGLSFARGMRMHLPEEHMIGVVPCAWDGSLLTRWEKGGDLYAQCLTRAKKAMEHGTIDGILWHHGETDASNYVQAVTYGDRLRQMVIDLRKDLGDENLPFVAGRLSVVLPNDRFPAVSMVNDGIDKLPKSVKNTEVVSVENLAIKPDKVHFDTTGARELGKRYVESMVSIQRKMRAK
jgi:hypothetical protein